MRIEGYGGRNVLKVHYIMYNDSGQSLFFTTLASCFSKLGMILTMTSPGGAVD